jgi:hypothetical protein
MVVHKIRIKVKLVHKLIIETLRSQQTKVQTPKAEKQNMNDENKDALIEILRMKVKELENKNKDLTKQLKKFQGSLYDQI